MAQKGKYYRRRAIQTTVKKHQSPEEVYQIQIDNLLNSCGDYSSKGHNQHLSEEQLKTLKEWDEYYKKRPSPRGGLIKVSSRLNCLSTLRQLGLKLKGKPFRPKDDKEIPGYTETIVDHIVSIKADSSRQNMKVHIREFYKWLYGVKKKHEFPKIVADERLRPVRAESTKKASDLLTEEEFQLMLNACYDIQDEATLMVLKESGGRAGELVSANVGSVEFDDYGCKIYTEKSKSEKRYIRLVDSCPYLKAWLNIHPFRNEPDKPLFIGKHAFFGNRLRNSGLLQRVQAIGKRAGIKKRIYSHLFRTMAITNLARKGFSLQLNARRHGITPLTVDRVYSKLVQDDVSDAYLSLKKAKTDEQELKEIEEEERLKPRKCPECGFINKSKSDYCQAELTGNNGINRLCGAPLSLVVAMVQDKEQKDKLSKMEEDMAEIKKQLQATEFSSNVIEKGYERKGRIDKAILKEVIKDMIKAGEITI